MEALSKYKNTVKSNALFFSEENHFSLFFFRNDDGQKTHQQFLLQGKQIQFYWAVDADVKVAFKMPHCALEISKEETAMVFFKDDEMPLLFDIPQKGRVIALFISVAYFHSIFAGDKSTFFNFDNLQDSKPILSTTLTKPAIKMILHQLMEWQVDEHLRALYVKGKVYEILSLYFTKGLEKSEETCPFVANEQTLSAIKKAKDIIIAQMASPPSLATLAKTTGLNLQKLKVGFKNYYGMPIYAFLLQYKMDLAKKMLSDKNYNIAEVSAQLGYSKSSHFIEAFKKKFGVTPKQFSKGC